LFEILLFVDIVKRALVLYPENPGGYWQLEVKVSGIGIARRLIIMHKNWSAVVVTFALEVTV
jgi:hypothetical protein